MINRISWWVEEGLRIKQLRKKQRKLLINLKNVSAHRFSLVLLQSHVYATNSVTLMWVCDQIITIMSFGSVTVTSPFFFSYTHLNLLQIAHNIWAYHIIIFTFIFLFVFLKYLFIAYDYFNHNHYPMSKQKTVKNTNVVSVFFNFHSLIVICWIFIFF